MATLSEQASRLLDFNQDLDIPLESFVGCMYSGSGEQVLKTTFLRKYFH